MRSEVALGALSASAYEILTSPSEADGTPVWDSRIMTVAEIEADEPGFGVACKVRNACEVR
jgi:hypothetical protein